MIKDFFRNTVISRSCGKNADGKTYMFGVFEQDPFSDGKHPLSDNEACAIIDSAYKNGNGIAKVVSSASAIDDIRNTGKHLILLNHSYADALMFNKNMPKDKAKGESALIALKKLGSHGLIPAVTEKDRNFIAQKSHSRDFDDLEMHFTTSDNIINLSRLARFNYSGKIGEKMDEYAEKNGITTDDLATFVFHHELGHQYVTAPYLNPHGNITTGEECADAYAAIWHLAKTGDTKLVEYLADFRNMEAIRAAARGKDAYMALGHYTTDVLDGIIDNFRKNPEQFRKAANNCNNIKDMASKAVENYGLTSSRYNELAVTIDTHMIINSDMGKRATETFKKLGILSDDAIKDDVMNAFSELGKRGNKGHIRLKDKIAIKKEIKREISEKTKSEVLNGIDYKRAFLTAYADMTSETVPNYETDARARYAYKTLHKILTNDKKTEKEIKTPINLLRRIAAETDDKLPAGDLTENYCRIKTDYSEKIKQITTAIKSGRISEDTVTSFKNAVGLAKLAQKIAITAKEKNLLPTDNSQLARIMEKEIKNEFPTELVRIASDKRPSWHQIKKLKQITI